MHESTDESINGKMSGRKQRFKQLLETRWQGMDVEERQQEALFFDHYAFGQRLKDLEAGFFLDYYQNHNPLVSHFSWKKITMIAEHVKRCHDVRHARILDVGCGCGFFFKVIGEGENHVGLDLSRIFIKGAKKIVPWVDLIHQNAKRLPFSDASFDVVVCNDVLEHAFFPDRIVREIDRVTKPGPNRIFISLPNEFNCRIGRIIALRLPVKWPFHINSLDPRLFKENMNRPCVRKISVPFNHVPWMFTLEQIFVF